MPLNAVLKVINVFLALATFLLVGGMSLSNDESLPFAVGKAVVSFVACWVILGWLVNLLRMVLEVEHEEPQDEEQGAVAEQTVSDSDEKG